MRRFPRAPFSFQPLILESASCSRGQVQKLLRQFEMSVANCGPQLARAAVLKTKGSFRRQQAVVEALWCVAVSL